MNASNDSHTGSLDYQVGQRVKYWRLKREYTQEDLAIEKLYAIAEALSVSVTDLMYGPRV